MSIFSDLADAVTPTESLEDRMNARAAARAAATPGDWLSRILDHHLGIEEAFAAVKAASPDTRKDALKKLGVLLTGHSIAEEAVIYPAMAEAGDKRHASHAYTEQATVKIEMAELEKMDPASEAFVEKLEAIEEAVAHHVYEEESSWFPSLKDSAPAGDQSLMSQRYQEEFERYVGKDGAFNF